MKKFGAQLLWLALALLGAWAYVTLALHRGERINSIFILIAALCTYAIGYRFYAKWIATRLLMLNDRRATPCEVHDDGKDFCKTNKWIVFGHHFAAISGPGPLVGPVLAAQFGYLPGTLWILIGVVLGGAVQDFVILFCSIRRDGKSLGQMVKEELNGVAGAIAMVAILSIMVILLAVLGLVVVRALAESPWGVFTVSATIPIAMLMGGYLRYWRVGKVLEVTVAGAVLLLLAVWGGKFVHESSTLSQVFTLKAMPLAWGIILYGLAASILPVWLLLAPRDYLSTFMKLGTIFALALGIFVMLPDLQMPALTQFAENGKGLVLTGKLFPFCFITIACGSISGFHTLIASGTTPKIITRESYARPIGYGAMCLESLVAIMAMIAACTLDPGVYFSMNMKGEPVAIVEKVSAAGFPVAVEQMQHEAQSIGENTLFGRTGGAATLAVGMAHIFSKSVGGRWLDLWYHFAIMFEALFILTTIDAGTRVGRYLLQDLLGHLWKPLGQTNSYSANLFASILLVAGWGYFLIQGVRDPLGGINSLWPLFGIANQMLAAIALCLATTVILKMQLNPKGPIAEGRPVLALVTFLPLAWLVAVTFTAGVQKIWSPEPTMGFLAQAKSLNTNLPVLEREVSRRLTPDLQKYSSTTARELRRIVAPLNEELAALKETLTKALAARDSAALNAATRILDAKQSEYGPILTLAAAKGAVADNRAQHINNLIDAVVTIAFLSMVSVIVLLSLREWALLLGRKKLAQLQESEAVWLPDYAIAEARTVRVGGLFVLAFALAKELSGEAQLERARQMACACEAGQPAQTPEKIYVEVTNQRFNGVRRCC